MKNAIIGKIKQRGAPAVLAGGFYACLCVFSLIVGMSCILRNATGAGLQQSEMSAESYSRLQAVLPIPISVFFGIVTVIVGIAQGASAYGLLAGRRKLCWGFALGFTVFSLFSCSAKLLTTVTLFPVLKTLAYILVLIAICMKRTRADFGA